MMEKLDSTSSNKNAPGESYMPHKEQFAHVLPRSPLSTHILEIDSIDLGINRPRASHNSIDQLYHNICEMESSDQSPSRFSYLSYGQESRIDSELRYLAGGYFPKTDGIKRETVAMTGEKEAVQSHDLTEFGI